MKTMCPPGYHYNGFVTTHTLAHMNYKVKFTLNIHIVTNNFTLLLRCDLQTKQHIYNIKYMAITFRE